MHRRQPVLCGEACEPFSVKKKDCVGHYDESLDALLDHRREGAVELAGTSDLQELKLHSQRSSRDLHLSYHDRVARVGRVREDRDKADLRDGLLEQLQPFAVSFRTNCEGQSGDVPARARQARDESELNRIASGPHDDGDGPGGVLCCDGHGRWPRYDDLRLESDQLGREIGNRSDLPSANR